MWYEDPKSDSPVGVQDLSYGKNKICIPFLTDNIFCETWFPALSRDSPLPSNHPQPPFRGSLELQNADHVCFFRDGKSILEIILFEHCRITCERQNSYFEYWKQFIIKTSTLNHWLSWSKVVSWSMHSFIVDHLCVSLYNIKLAKVVQHWNIFSVFVSYCVFVTLLFFTCLRFLEIRYGVAD